MSFFENFSDELGVVPVGIMDDLRANAQKMTDETQGLYKRKTDRELSGGEFVPIVVEGKPVNLKWDAITKPVVDYIASLNLPCLRGRVVYRNELSIIPPGGKIDWHHDIYLKDKLCERIHVPIITTADTLFLSKWFVDDDIWAYRMKQDSIYRFNNRVIHAVKNSASERRIHLMFNYMRTDIFDYLQAHPDELKSFDMKVTSVTSACETFYYSNPNAKAHKLPNTWPAGEFQALMNNTLSTEQIERLLRNTNTETWSTNR